MPERKVKIKLGNEEVDAWDVPIRESTDRWSDIKLEDGTVLRLKPVVANVMRVEGRKDNDGNPLYAVKSSNVLVVAEVGAQSDPKVH